jgi:hypothetical protein
MLRLYGFLSVTAIVAVSCVFALDYYCDLTCPTSPSEGSGHVFPLFDKHHSRYVYVTAFEKDCIPILICVGVGCVFAGVFVSKKISADERLRQLSEETNRDS